MQNCRTPRKTGHRKKSSLLFVFFAQSTASVQKEKYRQYRPVPPVRAFYRRSIGGAEMVLPVRQKEQKSQARKSSRENPLEDEAR
jgi:hypothetical protein